MINRPKVSFVCSVKDGSKHLARCAQSVLGQSMKEIELILVDDHSSDGTWAAMEDLAKGDGRVRAIKNLGREGLTYSLNMGLDFAKGDFVARIDVDDFAHRDRAERQASILESNPAGVMVTGQYRLVNEGDWLLYSHCPPSDPKALRWSLCFRNHIRHSTVMWKKSLGLRYEPAFKYAQDYELWSRISRLGDILVLSSICATIKTRPDSITSTKHEEQESAADLVCSNQWHFYTGASITRKEARFLRMIHHMKSGDQFEVFNKMSREEFEGAVVNYCLLACRFAEKESPDMETFMNDIGNDIKSLLANPSRDEQTLEALAVAKDQLGDNGTMEEIIGRFIGV